MVERCNFACGSPEEYGSCGELWRKDGEYVRFEDYSALERERDALAAALREVWDSVPASHAASDPMVQRHAKALNAIPALLAPRGDGEREEGRAL